MKEFKEIKLGQQGDIFINGKKYHMDYRFTPERHLAFRSCMIRLNFGAENDLVKIDNILKTIYESLNNSKVADATIKVHNAREKIKDIKTKTEPALEACSYFLIREDEDVSKLDLELQKEKIKDFNSGEYLYENFLALALGIQSGLKEN